MTAFFGAVIRFGFDNAGAEPQSVDFMAYDFSQQFTREQLGVAVEKGVWQQGWHRQSGHWRAEKHESIASHA